MSHTISVLVLLAVAAVRLLRYLRKKAPARAAPKAAQAAPAPEARAAAAVVSPLDPPREINRGLARVAAALAFVLGNAVLWGCLFGLPALAQIPAAVRVAAGVLANFVIIQAARGRAAGAAASREDSAGAGQNPIR